MDINISINEGIDLHSSLIKHSSMMSLSTEHPPMYNESTPIDSGGYSGYDRDILAVKPIPFKCQ
jgi:hypothetical protein